MQQRSCGQDLNWGWLHMCEPVDYLYALFNCCLRRRSSSQHQLTLLMLYVHLSVSVCKDCWMFIPVDIAMIDWVHISLPYSAKREGYHYQIF